MAVPVRGAHRAVESLGPALRWQHHPSLAAIRASTETAWLRELTAIRPPADLPTSLLPALRPTAARNRLPAVYGWLAKHADRDQVVPFLSWEGGPDAGFDDLVATCQLGLSDPAKTELATPCGGRYCCAAGWIAG